MEIGDLLIEALPYMQKFNNKVIIVKFGGHVKDSSESSLNFARDIVMLKQCGMHPIVVHGGGPQINQMLDKLAIKSEFVKGQRKTDSATLAVAQMVLCGQMNKELVQLIQKAGGQALGLSGIDGRLLTVDQLPESSGLGLVGDPVGCNLDLLNLLINSAYIPVIAPIASDKAGNNFNVNADNIAGYLAGALSAERLLLLTDVAGILNKNQEFIHQLNLSEAETIITDGTVFGGMIPKVQCCISALKMGTKATVILDGRKKHAILIELFTDKGSGTIITNNPND